METAIYVRVSTEEQAQEGFSIRAQEQKLKEFAKIKDWSIFKIYMDEGISGKNLTERPAMQEMIADIEKGLVKNVLVFKIDRLTRSTADLIYLIDLFNAQGCAFNSLTESMIDDAMPPTNTLLWSRQSCFTKQIVSMVIAHSNVNNVVTQTISKRGLLNKSLSLNLILYSLIRSMSMSASSRVASFVRISSSGMSAVFPYRIYADKVGINRRHFISGAMPDKILTSSSHSRLAANCCRSPL